MTFINKTKRIVFILAVTVFFGSSCKHKTDFNKLNEVSYTTSISPIIASNCAHSGCHGDTVAKSFNLMTYSKLIAAGIEAGSPENSKLYNVLKTLDDKKIMPKRPYSDLTTKQIQLIYVWIGQGAKNN